VIIIRRKRTHINGQISVWDMPISIFESKNVKHIDETEKFTTINIKENIITDLQKIIINRYKDYPNLNRIIKYCGGGFGIELLIDDEIITKYVNKNGEEEFTFNKKSTVLPMDNIIFYKEDVEINTSQKNAFRTIKDKDFIIIKRKGDENIILKYKDKVTSITSKELKLDFYKINTIYDINEIINKAVFEDDEDIKKKLKLEM